MVRSLEGPGGGWRPGLGGAAPSWGRGLDAREATHPSPNTRCPFSRSTAEPELGAGEAGVIPEGIPPPPPPTARRPHTHVNAGPARIPPAAQRVAAPRRYLGLFGFGAGAARSLAGPRCPGRALRWAPAPASPRSAQADARAGRPRRSWRW